MPSINTQVRRVSGLLDAQGLSDFDHDFVTNIAKQTNDGNSTSSLTMGQIESIERIYGKHFAD